MSTEITPARLDSIVQVIGTQWNADVHVDWTDSQRVAELAERLSGHPEVFRGELNLLQDLLADERYSVEDKVAFISQKANRTFDTPGDGMAWLSLVVDALDLTRPTLSRTTRSDGPVPTLNETARLRGSLRNLKADKLPLPQDAARVTFSWRAEARDTLVDVLSRFLNSGLSDRDKADFIVASVGPFFYTDAAAIEWAAAVAHSIENRPRPVE